MHNRFFKLQLVTTTLIEETGKTFMLSLRFHIAWSLICCTFAHLKKLPGAFKQKARKKTEYGYQEYCNNRPR